MNTRRLLLSAVLMFWCVVLWFLSVPVRHEVSHTYHHWLADITEGHKEELPSLTIHVSLPILGDELHVDTTRSPLFYLYWSLLWFATVAIGVAVWIPRDSQRLMEVWVYSLSVYTVFVFCSALIILVGLWWPFMEL